MAIAFRLTPVNPPRIITSVGDALSQLPSFSTLYRQLYDAVEAGQIPGASPQDLATWRINFRSGVVNYGGRPVEIDFFRMLMGGTPQETEATSIAVRYNSTVDFNIYAQNDAVGTSGTVTNATYGTVVNGSYTGPYAVFTVALNTYAANGTLSNVNVGDVIYIPNDAQMVQVIRVDKSVNFAHQVYVVPFNSSYTIQIYSKQAMHIGHIGFDTGYSDITTNPPHSEWETLGYTKYYNPFSMRTSWQTPRELEKAYKDVLQFPIIFDMVTGAEIDSFDFKAAADARERLIMAENMMFWEGQVMNNTNVTVNFATNKYTGFDGLTTSMFYGGGNIQTYTPTFGWDLDVDYNQIRYKNDALKLSEEMLMICALRFSDSMQRRSQDLFKNNSGGATFQTFARMGEDMAAIERMGIQSFKWGTTTIHIKVAGPFSDSRWIGTGYYPNAAFILPGDGLTDSNGRPVPPVEFYIPKGRRVSSQWEEHWVDGMNMESQATRFTGTITHTIQMGVHGVENMWAVMPDTIVT
jgi:hypothetical protein